MHFASINHITTLRILALSVPAHVCICEEKLCTGYQAMYLYVLNENLCVMALGAKTMCYFYGSSVFWKLGYHPSLWIP